MPSPRASEPEICRLREEVGRLNTTIRDLEIALSTSNEHGDLLQEHLYRFSASLTAEIRERQAAEEKQNHCHGHHSHDPFVRLRRLILPLGVWIQC